ncbi:hypothetical protein AB1L42_14265 [Thalassoglobus sp. JC818]|uniref:hypothetical protein n=1 Tax=Thalassoglobus sp. JC818 TaxID=3232136 RepID=UPI00345AA750
MNLSVIAAHPDVVQIVHAVEESDQLTIGCCWTPDSGLQHGLNGQFPTLKWLTGWDQMLSDSSIDAVVVVGANPEILAAARQFQVIGKPVVILTSALQISELFDYTALWQESPELIRPLFASGVNQLIQSSLERFHSLSLGKLWRVEFDRQFDPSSFPENGFTKDRISETLEQDLAALSEICPSPEHVMMLATGPDSERPVEVTVRMVVEDEIELNWNLKKSDQQIVRVRLSGTDGQVVGELDTNNRITIDGMVQNGDASSSTADSDQAIVDELRVQLEAIANETSQQSWQKVIRYGEIGAAAQRSLLKGRKVPLHFEETSERNQFKSQMAAFGCGTLLWTMFGAIGLLILGSVMDPRDREYIASKSAGFVLGSDDFADDSSSLTPDGESQLQEIRSNWTSTSPVLIIESDDELSEEVLALRRSEVVERIESDGLRSVDTRVSVRAIPGAWYENMMKVGWVLVFLPLGLVLAAQLLLFVARPTESPTD